MNSSSGVSVAFEIAGLPPEQTQKAHRRLELIFYHLDEASIEMIADKIIAEELAQPGETRESLIAVLAELVKHPVMKHFGGSDLNGVNQYQQGSAEDEKRSTTASDSASASNTSVTASSPSTVTNVPGSTFSQVASVPTNPTNNTANNENRSAETGISRRPSGSGN